MTMTFSLHDSIGPDFGGRTNEYGSFTGSDSSKTSNQGVHILEEKINPPSIPGTIERKRIISLLSRSVSQFPATLVTGRAGSGKTALAAAFAAQFSRVSWYSIESTDASWSVFSNYLSASLRRAGNYDSGSAFESKSQGYQTEIARFMLENFGGLGSTTRCEASLIVLDDIQHLFDAEWFDYFFNLLIHSLPSRTHVLMLCRSKPPSPLWRLRSKQMLNVIDEKVIAFDQSETEALFEVMKLPTAMSGEFQRQSFGRISKILRLAEDHFSNLPSQLA